MGRSIFDQSEFMQLMFAESFDNAISYYRSIEGNVKQLADELSEVAVNGMIDDIQDTYDDVSRAIDDIRNEKVFNSDSTYTTAQNFFTVMWDSDAVSDLAREGSDNFKEILFARSDLSTAISKAGRRISQSSREKIIEEAERLRDAIYKMFDTVDGIESGASSEVRKLEEIVNS